MSDYFYSLDTILRKEYFKRDSDLRLDIFGLRRDIAREENQ